MPTVLITGGTGLIGTALTGLLVSRGYQVIIMGRSKPRRQADAESSAIRYATWDIKGQTIDREAVGQADYIIHLAGAGVADKRWTAARKKEILDSRRLGSALIVDALRQCPNRVRAVISASAIGWYGPDAPPANPAPFVESDPADPSFLGHTCRVWEESILPVEGLGKRLVLLRTGIVLSRAGGALPAFIKPVRMGVAAILGSGKQIISWVHMDDLCRMYVEAMENQQWQGIYNAVSPHPVSNRELTLELARMMKGKFYIPLHVPQWVLKLMMGELSIEVLKSATVSADKARNAGFQFLFPTIHAALGDLVNQ